MKETKILMNIIRDLTAKGVAVSFNRTPGGDLRNADIFTVLPGREYIGTYPLAEIDIPK